MNRGASTAERNVPPLVRWTSPTARLVTGAVLVAAIATAAPSPVTLGVGACTAVGCLVLARPSLKWFAALAAVGTFAIAGVLVPLFATGDVERATFLAARALVVLTVGLAFAWTQRAHELGGALRGVGVPATFAAVVATMVRQTSLLSTEGRRLLLARELRGARRATFGPEVLARLFLRSHAKAERTALAAELRGARAGFPRPIPMRPRDGVPVGIAAGLGTVIHLLSGAVP